METTPVWDTPNACPAIVMVALRSPLPVLAATAYSTVPFPEPLVPEVMVTHPASLEAVQLHPAVVVTVTVPFPPADAKDRLRGLMPTVHVPSWVTLRICPAMAIVPLRELPVFAATL
jgi:hypothetical protein